MSNFTDPSPEALAIAGGAIAMSLVDFLIQRKIITADDGRSICRNAQDRIRSDLGMRGDQASVLIEKFIRAIP